MSLDWNSTKEALTSGIRSARVKPESTSRALTVWMKAARLTLTVSLSTVTAPVPHLERMRFRTTRSTREPGPTLDIFIIWVLAAHGRHVATDRS
jgi:hypothetical protein